MAKADSIYERIRCLEGAKVVRRWNDHISNKTIQRLGKPFVEIKRVYLASTTSTLWVNTVSTTHLGESIWYYEAENPVSLEWFTMFFKIKFSGVDRSVILLLFYDISVYFKWVLFNCNIDYKICDLRFIFLPFWFRRSPKHNIGFILFTILSTGSIDTFKYPPSSWVG